MDGKGQRGPLVNLVEVKSRFILMQLVYQRLTDLFSKMKIAVLSPFMDFVHTITGDIGKEYANLP